MKQLVLTEGKNDVCFVDYLVSEINDDLETNKFLLNKHLKEEGGGLLIPKESNMIRKFVGKSDTKDVLIKGEGSKENLLKVFGNLLAELCQFEICFIVMIDRDGQTVDELTDSLQGNAGSMYGGDVNIENVSSIKYESGIEIISYEIDGDNGMCDSFDCISYPKRLEDAADVNKDNERNIIEDSIRNYVENDVNTSNFDEIFN